MSNPRLQALHILKKTIRDSQPLSYSIDTHGLSKVDSSLCKQLCFGVMREIFILEKILKKLLKKPLKNKDIDVKIIIFLGLYQLLWLHMPDHASINETVKLSTKIKKIWAKNLINALLRSAQRNPKIAKYQLEETHPSWLLQAIQKHYPNLTQDILRANQSHAPMILRISSAVDTDKWMAQLPVGAHKQLPSAVILDKGLSITQILGFEKNGIFVQDAAFQYAAMILDLMPNQRVLDACAAPGGKSCHLLETEPNIHLIALDNQKRRLQKVADNLKRLPADKPHQIKLVHGDASLQSWWDRQFFERILCDVPCSATGIIRRQPDIKFLCNPATIDELIQTQLTILTNCWAMLAQGGILLYSTCSILPEENDAQIKAFCAEHLDAYILPIEIPIGTQTKFGVQGLPCKSTDTPNHDGFYYAKIQKIQPKVMPKSASHAI